MRIGVQGVPPPLGRVRSARVPILALAARYGLSNVRLYGDAARGAALPDGPIELLVDAAPGRSLWDVGAFATEVEALLGHPVFVLTAGALREDDDSRARAVAL